MSDDILFSPFTVKGLTLPNRIVMAPMTRSMAEEGVPGSANAEYYRRRAEGGVGLILTEGTVVDRPASRNMPGIPFFHGEAALAGWDAVAKAVHAAGGRIGPQIWHTGSTHGRGWEPDAPVESPSGLVGPDEPRGVVMTEEDIADTVAAFARAAADAKRLGFDTVELHGAHGYLIDQFFWPGTNKRTDVFGGATIRERSYFAAEVIRAVRAAIGDDFPLILRVSQWKQQDYSARLATSPQEMTDWLAPLVEAGVDVLHCSQRRFWEPEFPEIDGAKGLNFAGWAKKLTGAATISVGSVGLSSDFFAAFGGEGSGTAALDNLYARMEREEFDLIAVGRVLLSDAQWVQKVRTGQTDKLRGFDAADLAVLA
ncbi:NADH:flavin oxidoreductase [Pectobacterium parmentieri]|uniref:NADH-dependent flavin oxidoreductase, Oye n=1 Tax=Pectobacterium parmentieri TaxID=1905730 RepID=A0A0H3I5I6_PECPM|nr:NADH:flavin oxidoreductase [Pectobacterium parmentieri]AFI89201.1 NADH-dependent flavin oxidoreductase, Oye [Pectobacterium parmentieri]AYH00482.1 12-oxophytodienoate reductase [Pectobacterium parmentieri]AYH26719.1 12-oxophytodienoate reductase [Pectobacterium parmentieri]MBI0472285.1 NADH:flavin oxidoreductase [Pectobacterium parmentieri]MBI0494929.1 NADH:flavin oxidoreductase [Pectobacterium parmentieri]